MPSFMKKLLGSASKGKADAAVLSSKAGQEAATVVSPSNDAGTGVSLMEDGAMSGVPSSLLQNMLDPVAAVENGKAYQVHHLGPPRPYQDEERCDTVKALGKIPCCGEPVKPQDPEIANVLQLVGNIFQAPVVLCALFDDKQVFVSERYGEAVPLGEFPWRWTLCGWSLAFKSPQVLVIPDTHKDARFANNKKVTDFPFVRFYCGVPMVASNGHRLGTLCFADVKPRPEFDRSACIMMNSFAELVTRQLEKDLLLKAQKVENQALSKATCQLQRTMDCLDNCVVLLDVTKPGWEVSFASAAWSKMAGSPRESITGKQLADLVQDVDVGQLMDNRAVKGHEPFTVSRASLAGNQAKRGFTLNFRPANRQYMDGSTVPVGVPSYLPLDGAEGVAQGFYFMEVVRGDTLSTKFSVGSSVMHTMDSSNLSTASLSHRGGLKSSNSSKSSSSNAQMEGLRLAHLLGRGSFGVVYYGTYFSTPVAVKVIDHDLFSLLGDDGAVKEATLALQLRHPNIVATLKHFVKTVENSFHNSSGSHHQSLPSDAAAQHDRDRFSAASNAVGECNAPSSLERTPRAGAGTLTSISGEHLLSTGERGREEEAPDAGAAQHTAWAVIQANPGDEAEDVDEAQVSEETLAMRKLCEVKPEGWASLPASAKGSVQHTPHHVQHQSPGTAEKQTWILLEFCDRGCLMDALDRGWLSEDVKALEPKPDMPRILATALEVASALEYMHSMNVVHGDMSAWNVMLSARPAEAGASDTRGFVAKVADMGMSRCLETVRITTKTYGTITHMPPETLAHGHVSKAMDVFSFGVLMWQLYTGSRPWSGLRQAVVIDNVVHKRMRLQWPEAMPAQHAAFRELAEACMAYDAPSRPTCSELRAQLRAQQA